MTLRGVTAAIAVLLAQAPFCATALAKNDPSINSVLGSLREAERESVDELIAIGSIVSPSGQERQRAAKVAELMREAGLSDVEMTAEANVIGRIPGAEAGKALVFVATLDDLATVAEHQAASRKPLVLQDDRVLGPGSNTSLGTAAMLAAADALVASGFRPRHDIIFAAVVQEETGLIGMRRLYEQLGDRAAAYVDILGDGTDIAYGALGIHWWRVDATGPAGHTLNGGLPNVNRGIAEAVSGIFDLAERTDPMLMTRLNIAILNSGKVFNHKPDSGWFSIDIRSLDAERIAGLEAAVDDILAKAAHDTGINLTRSAVSLVPGGQIEGARTSPLVTMAARAASLEGLPAELTDAGSANLNIAIAAGTPAIGLGGERGGGRGTAQEWASVPTLHRTARVVARLALEYDGATAAQR